MKLSCSQPELSRGLSIVNRAVATRSTMPILANILIETDEDRVKLSATNLEIGITCWLDANVEDSGGTTIPARLLSDFVNSLPEGRVDLALNGRNNTMKIESDRYKAEIKGITSTDFPALPSIAEGVRFSLDPIQLRHMIGQVVIAAATDDTRPVLTGVLLKADPDSGRLTLAAADGFRLSVRTGELDAPLDGPIQVIVPARALHELHRVANDEDDRITVAIPPNQNQIMFQLKDIDIVSQLLEGNFPDYEKIIPREHATRAVVNTKALHGAARIASFFARDAANVIRLRFEPGDEIGGTLTVTAQSAEVGGNESEIEAAIDGEPLEIAFNAKYLLDVLGVVDSEQTIFEIGGPSTAAVVRPGSETGFTHVIMPMHIAR